MLRHGNDSLFCTYSQYLFTNTYVYQQPSFCRSGSASIGIGWLWAYILCVIKEWKKTHKHLANSSQQNHVRSLLLNCFYVDKDVVRYSHSPQYKLCLDWIPCVFNKVCAYHSLRKARVYNCCSYDNPTTWGVFKRRMLQGVRKYPYDMPFWYPSGFSIENRLVVVVNSHPFLFSLFWATMVLCNASLLLTNKWMIMQYMQN